MDFSRQSTQKPVRKNYSVELHELETLAERAFHIPQGGHQEQPASEVAQYLEEEFIEYQAKYIRELAGHTNEDSSPLTTDKTCLLSFI